MGSDVVTNRTKVFAESQVTRLSDFASWNPYPRGGIQRPHATIRRKLRMLLHSSSLPSEHFFYLVEQARQLFNLPIAENVPTKSKHKRPTTAHSPLPGPSCLAGNSNTLHMVSVHYLAEGGGLKRRVVRSRDARFLDDTSDPDDAFDAARVPTAPLADDDPVRTDARQHYVKRHPPCRRICGLRRRGNHRRTATRALTPPVPHTPAPGAASGVAPKSRLCRWTGCRR